MMSEMGGSYEDDPDSSDEDAANTHEDELDDEGTDANGDGADSDNNDYDDDSEPEPEADHVDEALSEDGTHLAQQADMMDENAARIKRQRVE